jgi:hypothetical protein
VEHIFLYNAGWSDDTDAVLAPYIEEGLVSVTKWYKPGFSDHRRSGQVIYRKFSLSFSFSQLIRLFSLTLSFVFSLSNLHFVF